jgi:hypothetical protein
VHASGDLIAADRVHYGAHAGSFRALGVAGIITKPFDPMTLAATAKGFLQTP